MPAYVVILDIAGLLMAAVGFTMAFRQDFFRHLIHREKRSQNPDDDDPLVYVLRIAGVMIMVFGLVLAGMVTLFNVLQMH